MKELIQKHASQELAVKQYLQHYVDQIKDEQTLNRMLQDIGEYYEADRAYIFEVDHVGRVFNNTFEWCRPGVSAEIENLQGVPFEGLECWLEAFETRGEFYITSLSEDYVPGSTTYEILEPQGIESLMAAPVKVNGVVAGFLGVDNPRRNTDALLLLSVAASTCYSEISTERISQTKLRDTQVRLQEEEKEHTAILDSLANVYLTIDYVDLKKRTLQKISYQEPNEHRSREKQDAKEAFERICELCVAESYVDAVRTFFDLDTLDERLGSQPLISQLFQDKHERWQKCSFIPVTRDEQGHNLAVLCTVRNVSAEKQLELEQQSKLQEALEAAQSASRAKAEFLSNMSHDIHTPMNAIMGYASMMEKEIDQPEALLDHLHKLRISGNSLTNLINNVLEFSRLESGKDTILENVMDLQEEALPVHSVFASELAAKQLTLTVGMDIQHRYVYADAQKMRNITMNLVSNAIKYTPSEGRIHMCLKEYPGSREGYARYECSVSDNGIGMSPEFQKNIFESFSRERTTTESRVYGVGLGLAIVKKDLELMGGRIDVESEPGKGSTFKVTLEHRIAEVRQEEELAMARGDLRGRRILLTEDNDLNAEIAIALLEDLGARVERAEDGEQSVAMVEMAETDYFDLILMDIQMPGISGYDAARLIRNSSDPKKARTPIIAMTANAFAEDKQRAMETGMDGHLAKPIDVPTLVETLSEILKRRRG